MATDIGKEDTGSLRRGAPSRGCDANVLICDPRRDRWRRIEGLASAAGARGGCAGPSLDRLPELGPLAVALLAVDSPGAHHMQIDSVRGTVRQLQGRGVSVICYGDGIQCWPLAARCRLLLAGTPLIFDSASVTFERDLGCELQARLQAAASEGATRERLKIAGVDFVGASPAARSVLNVVERSARLSDMPVLLLGESGTGKELLARAVHLLDPRRCQHPFVAINCAALTKTLAEAELFGHRRGAFSGADRERPGFFRAANGGVLFLDEIGELDLDLQAKLLRAIQERRVLTLGDSSETQVDVRIVAATHRDLKAMVSEQRFRGDLCNRLWVYPVVVPPLRDRRDDIPELVQFFILKHAGADRAALGGAADFIEALRAVTLEGNLRQLENIVRRALVSANPRQALGLADLPPEVWAELATRDSELNVTGGTALPAVVEGAVAAAPTAPTDSTDLNLGRALASHEMTLIATALSVSRGNQTRAARLLGITPRSMYNKLRKHRIERREGRSA